MEGVGEGVEAAVTVRFPAENPPVKDQDIAEFWNWFASNADRLRKGGESNAAEFGKRLASLDPDLCWEMGGAKDEPWDLSIRSEDAEHRAMAFRVVEAAPALRDWLVSPFRQPGSTDMRLEWQDGTICDEWDTFRGLWKSRSRSVGRTPRECPKVRNSTESVTWTCRSPKHSGPTGPYCSGGLRPAAAGGSSASSLPARSQVSRRLPGWPWPRRKLRERFRSAGTHDGTHGARFSRGKAR